MSTRARLLALVRETAKPIAVAVDAWGGETVYARPMLALERAAFLDEVRSIDGKIEPALRAYAKLCLSCIVNEDGSRVFADSDFDTVVNLPEAGIYSVGNAILKASNVALKENDDAAEAREALEKN